LRSCGHQVLLPFPRIQDSSYRVNIYATYYWYLEVTADLTRDIAAASEGFITEGRQS
jgi:hypothetical protein